MAFNTTIAQLAMSAYGRALASSGMDFYDHLLTTGVMSEKEIFFFEPLDRIVTPNNQMYKKSFEEFVREL